MLTCKSPRKVLRLAYQVGRALLPRYSSKFSRHDFTLPQLFACLVLREHQNKSYRGLEALLADVTWGRQIGLKKTPDHNTLYRAFHAILSTRRCNSILALFGRLASDAKAFGLPAGLPIDLAIDATYFDTHHHSRHYDHRCRHHASKDKKTANARKAAAIKALPKLVLSVDTATHLILAAATRTGMSGDGRHFGPLLRQSCARIDTSKKRHRRIRAALADAGFDSHDNHVLAREGLKIESLIKADAGRPTAKAPTSVYRAQMKRELAGSQKGKHYGQRAQAETVNSMIKRNLGDALRARSNKARMLELLLRAITHNVMVPWPQRVETEPDAASF